MFKQITLGVEYTGCGRETDDYKNNN